MALITPLSLGGWLTAVAYTLVLTGALTVALIKAKALRPGPADRVTLARATLVGCVTVLVVESFAGPPTPLGLLIPLAAVALIGDAIDGQIARRTGTESSLGARFDMEVDAFLILVLSVFVSSYLGPWVLAMGLMRYVFVAASWAMPWLKAPLPHSMARKTVAAAQGIVLVLAASGLLPHLISLLVTAIALGSLVWSFGRDVLWLYHRSFGRQAG
ncbi:CDP-alcohol phosphatidyltransferase family protein [Kibdelosporangium banguiense]